MNCSSSPIGGVIRSSPPEARIKEELPEELREIFFTDGDRALSFIEADVSASTKQAKVRAAIKTLLGLDVIDGALSRVKKTASEVNRRVQNTVSDEDIAHIAGQLTELEGEQAKLEKQIRDAEQQFVSFDERHAAIEKDIESALAKGNREDLKRQLEHTRTGIQRVDGQLDDASKSHVALFRTLALSRELMAPVIEASLAKLDELRDQGKIPNSTIPVLEERLNASTCICGELIDGHDPEVVRRRKHIRGLIDQSRNADARQSIVTDLYFASRPLRLAEVSPEQTWKARYARVSDLRDGLLSEREQFGRQMKALEARIDQIPASDIQGLQRTRRLYRERRDHFNAAQSRHQTDLANVRRQQIDLERRRDQLLRQQDKGSRLMADFEVAQDFQNVLNRAYGRLTNEELNKVSARMNAVFLDMIGADPSQGAIIQRAEITEHFEITVCGPNERPLNPRSGTSMAPPDEL